MEGISDKNQKSKKSDKVYKKSCTGKGPRLYVKAVFTGFRRGQRTQDENHALVKIDGLNSRREAHFYLGKRIVYVYRTKIGYKTIWGRICSQHGNNGMVKARFNHNLPPKAIGATLRVMLYPYRNIHV